MLPARANNNTSPDSRSCRTRGCFLPIRNLSSASNDLPRLMDSKQALHFNYLTLTQLLHPMALPRIPTLALPRTIAPMDVSPSVQPVSTTDKPAAEKSHSTEVEAPFSIFSPLEKRWISFVASFGALFSTLSSYIYFPALVPMARDLGVSVALINLTVTSYLVVAGIAPAFMGDIADQGGRRPAYVLMFALMLGSNIGLALQNSYPLLLALRMIQSAGASGRPFTCKLDVV